MNITFSSKQMYKTGNLDAKLISHQYKSDLMARFVEINSVNPKLTQKEIAKQLGYSIFSSQRHRQDINMFSPHRIPPNSNREKQKSSNREHDLERLHLTSNDLKGPQLFSREYSPETVKPKKNKLKGGSKIEIKHEYLDEFLHNNNL